jgi:CubicO group peptidase (beta-lactamase class C family)
MSVISEILQTAILEKTTPGAAAAIIPLTHPKKAKLYFAGQHADETNAPQVHAQSIFDLASLSKIMCTAPLVAQAVADGMLHFTDTPFEQWPGVQIKHLLAHNAGLPAWKPFYQRLNPEDTGLASGKAGLIREVLNTATIAACEQETVYSDLGFIALGHLLETTYQQDLDVLYRDWLFKHIPDSQSSFVSLAHMGFHPFLNRVLPTEECIWRGRRMHGQVHDDNSFCMGGVSGHAGLFGRLEDVVLYGQWLYETLNSKTALGEVLQTMGQITGQRALAFDVPTQGGSTGEALSEQAIGHLGFTGTSFWLDRGDDSHPEALYILLTNRVYFKDSLDGIKKMRRHFHQKATTQLTHF